MMHGNAQNTCASIVRTPACSLMLCRFANHMPQDLQVQESAVCGYPDGNVNLLVTSHPCAPFLHSLSAGIPCWGWSPGM